MTAEHLAAAVLAEYGGRLVARDGRLSERLPDAQWPVVRDETAGRTDALVGPPADDALSDLARPEGGAP